MQRLDPRLSAVFFLLVAANLGLALGARSTSFGESAAYAVLSLVLLVVLAVVAFRLLRGIFRRDG